MILARGTQSVRSPWIRCPMTSKGLHVSLPSLAAIQPSGRPRGSASTVAGGETRAFEKFDRFAQFADSSGRTLASLLDEFATLRQANLRELESLRVSGDDLDRRGRHPELGAVTLRQLLATWVAHDLDHVVQISRVIARQYSDEVGPWRGYLRIISGTQG